VRGRPAEFRAPSGFTQPREAAFDTGAASLAGAPVFTEPDTLTQSYDPPTDPEARARRTALARDERLRAEYLRAVARDARQRRGLRRSRLAGAGLAALGLAGVAVAQSQAIGDLTHVCAWVALVLGAGLVARGTSPPP
jgi:hypothetical protein